MTLVGGIEAGGTKFVCAVGSSPDDIREEIRYPTSTPQENIQRAIDFFAEHHRTTPLAAIGIASFGPVDPDPSSPAFGYVTTTPKPHWAHTDFAGPIREAFGLPVGFDSDVNGAALGEQRWGAAQGLDTFVYLTIGTGLGGGGMANKLIHGLMHSEMGHITIPRPGEDPYPGWARIMGTARRVGGGRDRGPLERALTLAPDHRRGTWRHYLALGLRTLVAVSPQRIIMGGGVVQQMHLFPRCAPRPNGC